MKHQPCHGTHTGHVSKTDTFSAFLSSSLVFVGSVPYSHRYALGERKGNSKEGSQVRQMYIAVSYFLFSLIKYLAHFTFSLAFLPLLPFILLLISFFSLDLGMPLIPRPVGRSFWFRGGKMGNFNSNKEMFY